MKRLFFIPLFFLCLSLSAQDCIEWDYYRNITIDNTTSTALTDYQVRVQLNTSDLVTNGKLQSNGADISVFSEDCTPLFFWGDSLGTSIVTDVWVKIPSLPANSSTTIQVYYGNLTAQSIADGNNTFIFFDEFHDEAVDLTKWEAVGEFAQLEIVDSMLNYGSTSSNPGPRFKFVRTAMSFSEQVNIDFVSAISNSNGFGLSSTDTPLQRILFRQSGFGFDTINQVAYMSDTTNNGVSVDQDYPLLRFDRFAFNTGSITPKINASNRLELSRFANVGLGIENIDTFELSNVDMTGFHFILSSFSATNAIQLDNIRVRQSTPTPPTVIVGEEIFIEPNSVQTLIDPALIQVFPNPADQSSLVKIDLEESVLLEIVDVTGRKVRATINLVKGANHQLDLQDLAVGVYYLKFHRTSDHALLHTRALNVVR